MAHISEHPKVQVTILVDHTQAHGKSMSVCATNATVIADKGTQVNIWSLGEFLQ